MLTRLTLIATLMVAFLVPLTSPADPLTWELHPDPALAPPEANIGGLTVLLGSGSFLAWHDNGGPGQEQVMFNTSSDGISWDSSDPVYSSVGTNDAVPEVIIRDAIYYLWVGQEGGQTSRPNLATSADGINWTHQGSVDEDLFHYTILPTENGFEAWYRKAADSTAFFHATSLDGLNWNDDQPVLFAGGFDQKLASLDVVKANGSFHMWYSFVDPDPGKLHSLAYASSTDGITWSKHGPVSGFELLRDVSTPSVIVDDEILKIWVFQDGGGNQAYYAEGGRIPEPSTAFVLICCCLLLLSIQNPSAGRSNPNQ